MSTRRNSRKTGRGASKPVGMIGCGTPEIMFKASVKKRFGSIDGVLAIEVRQDKIILRVRDEQVKDGLPKSFRRRPIEVIVTGPISKRS